VVATAGAAPARPRLRRGRPVPVSGPNLTAVPLTHATIVRPEPLGARGEALAWLERASADEDEADALLAAALRALNRLLHAQRTAAQDPYLPELGPEAALLTRLGFGTGDQLAGGGWTEARELPPPRPHRRRVRPADLRPQERIAAVLAGRERVDACETLLLRARADLDQGRGREAAIQLAAGLDALLAELPADPGPDQEADLAELEGRRDRAGALAADAVHGDPGPVALEQVAETLRICERVLRRRRLLAG